MKKIRKITITLILIIFAITFFKTNKIYAKINNSDISVGNNYIKDETLTYRKEKNGETLISGFKIGEKVSEVLNGKFGEDYTIKIKNKKGTEITNEPNTKIGTGYKIELYLKDQGKLEKTYTVVIYGDANGDANIGAVDALAVVKNKLGTEKFESKEYEEAGRTKIETRTSGVVPKADDALYIIKYKLYPEQYPIDQKMIGTDEEEKIENGDNKEGTTNGTITGGEYKKENPVIPVGFETVNTEDANWNSTDGETVNDWNKGLTIQDKLGNQFIWIPVNKEEYKKQLAERNDEEITNLSSLTDDILPSRIEKEIEQIEKYGGFYISRYEAGIPETMTEAIQTASAETRNVEGTPISKIEQIAWNYIDYNTAKKNAENMYQTNNIQSGLITGTKWDTLTKWLETIEGNKPVESTLREWTSEEYNNYKIVRGENNGEYPSAYRAKVLPEETSENIGYRVILYIQETKLPEHTEKEIKITFNANGGNVTPTTKVVKYNETYGELPIPSREEYTFTGWYTTANGGTQITENTIVDTTSNQTLYAHWQIIDYTLTVKHYLENANDTGYTYQEGKDTTENIPYGTTITLSEKQTTIENGTYHHATLEENGTATTTTTIGTNTTIYLYYSRNQYTLTVTAGENIASVTGTGSYKVGETVTIDATLNTETGYEIDWSNWTSDNTNLLENNLTKNATITMPAGNVTLTANATKTAISYTLTVKHYLENANDTGYTYQEGKDTTESIPYGTTITLSEKQTTIENGTYHHATLEENGTVATTTTMGTNTTIYLYYSRNQYTLTVTAGENIASVTGTGLYKVGQNVTIDATLGTAETGYTISWSNWTSNNTSLLSNNSTKNATIIMPAGNVTLTANATKTVVKYTLTIRHYLENANDTGYTYQEGKDTTESIPYGTTITLSEKQTTIENGTYHHATLEENGTVATTTTMGTNTTIYLYYTRNTYTLTLNRGSNIASVTGSGTYKVGKSVTIDATLNTETGYTISWSNWTSNNTSLLSNNSTKNATITMPAGDVTLTANATRTATIQYYTVTCIDKVGNASGATLGTTTWSAALGSTVSGSSASGSYAGYTYSSCTSATVTTSGATVYRFFAQASAGTLNSSYGWSSYAGLGDDLYYTINGLAAGDRITITFNQSGTGSLLGYNVTPYGVKSTSGTYTYTVSSSGGVEFQIWCAEPPGGVAYGYAQITITSITNSAGVPYTLN